MGRRKKSDCLGYQRSDNIKLLADSAECELARLYRFTTLYLSMKPLEHEYKVMGLALIKSNTPKRLRFFHTIVKVEGLRVLHRNRPKTSTNI